MCWSGFAVARVLWPLFGNPRNSGNSLLKWSCTKNQDPIFVRYDGRKSEKMMLASPLDPQPDLRKDSRQWSIFMTWRSWHCDPQPAMGAHCCSERASWSTARAKDKEQRPSHSDSDSVVSHKGRAGHKDHVALRHGLCDQLDLRAAPEFWQRQGPRTGPRCKNRFCGFWVPNVLVFMLNRTDSHSLGHLEAPHGDFDQISGTVVRLLARLQGDLVVLRVGVPQFLFGRNHHVDDQGVQTMICSLPSMGAHCCSERPRRTKNKGRVTVTATVWWVTKAEVVTKTVSQSWREHLGSPRVLALTGHKDRASVQEAILWFRTCWYSCWTESHSLDTLRPHVVISTMICSLPSMGAHCWPSWSQRSDSESKGQRTKAQSQWQRLTKAELVTKTVSQSCHGESTSGSPRVLAMT